MIKLNSNNVNKIYNGSTLITGIDYNGASRFTYFGGDSPSGCQITGCPDLVSSISSYQGTAMEVYDKTAQKWYMRNNLDQYEEYGLFADNITTATTYCGKLAKVDNTEYEWNGTSWESVGNATGTSVTIQSPSYIYNDSNHMFGIPLAFTGSSDARIQIKIKSLNNGGGRVVGDHDGDDQHDYRFFATSGRWYWDINTGRIQGGTASSTVDNWLEFGNYYIKDLSTGTNLVTGQTTTFQRSSTMYLGNNAYDTGGADRFQLSALTMYHGDTVARDFIPAIDNGEVCLYDKVSNAYFKSHNGRLPLSGGTISQVEVGNIEWPKDYDEKEAPATSVTVSDLSEVECPYEGLVAYVNGTKYTYTNGEWVEAIVVRSPSYIYNDANHNFSIPLDYTASTDTKFTMRIKPTTSGGGSILGESYTVWDDNNDYRIFLYQNKFCYDAVNKRLQTSFTALNNDLNIEFGTWYIKNLDTSAVVSAATFNYQRSSTVYLGAINYGGAVHTDLDLFQLSALTMYHGNTLERDFIPAIDSNDEICLYDKVSKQYFKSDNGIQPLSGGTITNVVIT